MTYRDTASFGKRIEFKLIGEILMQGLDVYLPLVDDHGVDCIVKTPKGTFIEIQIKSRSDITKRTGCFTVDNHNTAINNFYFIFYAENTDTRWVFTSKEFIDNAKMIKSGLYAGRKKLNLNTKKGNNSKKYSTFIIKDFSFLKNL